MNSNGEVPLQFFPWFPHNYAITLDPEFPPQGELERVFSLTGDERGVGSRSYVRVQPSNGEHFHLVVPSGDCTFSIACATPNPDKFVYCFEGNGLLADTRDPHSAVELDIWPVLGAHPVPQHALLLLWNYSSIMALGVDGSVWVSHDLVTDDLAVSEIDGTRLLLTGWDCGEDVSIEIDVLTGRELRPATS